MDEDTKKKFNDFINECKKISSSTGTRADLCMYMHNTINIVVVSFGCAIGFVSMSPNWSVLASAMGFSIAFIKGVQEMLRFPQRSIKLKQFSIKMKNLLRKAESALLFPPTGSSGLDGDSLSVLHSLYQEKEKAEMELYKTLIVSNDASSSLAMEVEKIDATSTGNSKPIPASITNGEVAVTLAAEGVTGC